LKEKIKVYFPGLNGLRFFAALAVIITHVELIKGVFGYKSFWSHPLFFNLGGLGVYFFFVLSGFLITYLLLIEQQNYGRISVRQFYIRRILRIWPLYYLVLVIGFFILPNFDGIRLNYLESDFNSHFTTNLVLYLLILPNLAFSLYTAVPHIGQSWSIGVEEQFYIAWPWIVSRSVNLRRSLIIVIIVMVGIKALVLLIGLELAGTQWYEVLKTFLAMSKFECMAVGGLGALYLKKNEGPTIKFLLSRKTFNASLILIPLLIFFFPASLQDAVHLLFSVAFLVVILYFAAGCPMMLSLENKVLSYLGNISYGIYMYHLMIIPMVLYFIRTYLPDVSVFWLNICAYGGSLLLTIGVSAVSYHLYESWFIRLKQTFSKVRSGSEIREF
jgi:peptidoglycan/LPS O-acetylase OafA/YrhL